MMRFFMAGLVIILAGQMAGAQPSEDWQNQPWYGNFYEASDFKKIYRLRLENPGKLPENIEAFQNLHSLVVQGNDWDSALENLPAGFYKLINLREFAFGNTNIATLSPQIAQLKNLETLIIGNNRITQLPPELAQLPKLKKLTIPQEITEIPSLPQIEELTIFLSNFEAKAISGLDKLLNLRHLRIEGWGSIDVKALLQTAKNLPKLTALTLKPDLDEAAAEELKHLQKLQSLDLQSFAAQTKWLTFLVNLENLTIQKFYPPDGQAENPLSVVAQLPFLKHFATTFRRKNLPDYQKFKKLELFFDDNEHLSTQDVDNLLNIKGLYKLNLREFPPNLGKLRNLEEISLLSFRYQLNSLFISQLAQITGLKRLLISAENLREVPTEFAQLKQLKQVWIYDYSGSLPASEKQKIKDSLPLCEVQFL
jgi:Leucine-rich repeat (LRR) protein